MKTFPVVPHRLSLAIITAVAGPFLLPQASLGLDHSLVIPSYNGVATCLDCHGEDGVTEDKAAEIMATTHWTWDYTVPGTGQKLGKKHVINNYCVAVPSNEPRCTSCHIGIGWRDDTFDFNDPYNLDCLVCHDTTGTYKKTPTGAGAPDPSVDLLAVAQSVGLTSRQTCGACHFFGGGGDAVKHGDLDSTMTNPLGVVDFHMGTDSLNMTCADCHRPARSGHHMVGSRYSAEPADALACADCHDTPPHDGNTELGARLNTHMARVACQTCHIPNFARGGKGTKMTWDWSTAGVKNPDTGGDLVIKDEDGNPIYHTKKGTFTWQDNVVPEYRWFNGNVTWVSADDSVSSNALVTINQHHGDIDDTDARIVPVKRFTGYQPYDAGLDVLAIPHLFPYNATDMTAFWKSYDWDLALEAGQAAVGRTYSGQLGFLDTEMFWVQNHMVAPKEMALQCTNCHTPQGQLNFAELGYPPEEALQLQTLAGFDIDTLGAGSAGGMTEVMLEWTGVPGYSYQVQYSNDGLVTWTPAPNGDFAVLAGQPSVELQWTHQGPGMPAEAYKIVRTLLP